MVPVKQVRDSPPSSRTGPAESKGADALRSAALVAMRNAYAPYSGFKVGAAVVNEAGRVFAGANVENSSYGLTVCAERSAIFQAIAAGSEHIGMLAIVADSATPAPSCGACRQVLSEFAEDAIIISYTLSGLSRMWSLSELLPVPFGKAALARSRTAQTR